MNLKCLDKPFTKGLSIYIDVSDINSWDLNTAFTSVSLTSWSNAVSDNINLYDFGLTSYDNGRTNRMYDNLQLTPSDIKLKLYRVGYNNTNSPFTGDTFYDQYSISAVTNGFVGNYFQLNGGYLQGFFKLKDYNYEVFPSRYNGITVENLIYIDEGSFDGGIFFLMGTRAEDKYNLFFSGETEQNIKRIVKSNPTGVVGQRVTIIESTTGFSGVTTSEGNYLVSYIDEEEKKKAFSDWAFSTITVPKTKPQVDNIKNNIIAFFLDSDKKIGLKTINSNGLLEIKKSEKSLNISGWTFITHVFIPDEIVSKEELECYPRRKGNFYIYVNGGLFWKISNFDEYYFTGFENDKEKQIGVPFNISWGGGSFGLKHSWHYDLKKFDIYNENDQNYIENNFIVTVDPDIVDNCFTGSTGGTYNSFDILLSADTSTFYSGDECDPNIEIPYTVLKIEQTGATATTQSNYFILFNNPIEALSNRDYNVNVDVFDTGIFKGYDITNNIINGNVRLVAFGTTDILVNKQTIYYNIPQQEVMTTPYSILNGEFQYFKDGLIVYGESGYPVNVPEEYYNDNNISQNVSGTNKWNKLNLNFKLKENSGKQLIYIGLIIESEDVLNDNFILYLKDFHYLASDKLSQDISKDNLLIEQNFSKSFNGGIQKLRIYDYGFSGSEVLYNVLYELKNKPNLNYTIVKGGRIINKL